jgi:SWI/SNF-related matrix-associated actin-dependent regulator of chromatin subfamily A-like protein 1
VLTPRPYQIEGRDFLARRRHALLADEMRVGKSCQAIMAADKLRLENVLVVCPAIAVPHWHREFTRWSKDRIGPWVMSYDRLRRDWDFVSKWQTFDLAIVDECHFAKNPEAQRTKIVYGKGGLGWICDRLWALSGTPATKHAGELWPMLKAFGVVKMTYEEFVNHYCVVNRFTEQITGTKPDKIPEVRALLAQVMLRRTRKEVAPEMPGIDFQFLEVEPDIKADIQLPPGLSEAELADWLDANPTVDRDDRIAVAQAKVLPLAKQIDFAIQNELLKQTVVFGWHTEPLEHLARLLNECGIRTELLTGKTTPRQREVIQNNFRNGLTKVVVGNILAAGTAIDLSSASHGFFLELDWLSVNNVQAANRLVSLEKKEPVTYDVVTWPGSADDKVQRVLMRRVRELSQLY